MSNSPRSRAKTARGGRASRAANKPSISNADPALVVELAIANRILFDQDVVDGFGHVSVRHDKAPDCFLLARNMAPGLVTAADIMAFDLDGDPLDTDPRPVYLERFIHAEIYRARREVGAVVHSHSPAVIPFSVVKSRPLRPVFHMAHFLPRATPIFEIRSVDPASDLLIRSPALGVALARSIGSNAVVLMRGHGATVVGTSLKQAVYQAIYTEVNARLQAMAMQLGPVTYLSDAEAARAAESVGGQAGRAWELWRRQALAGSAVASPWPASRPVRRRPMRR